MNLTLPGRLHIILRWPDLYVTLWVPWLGRFHWCKGFEI